MKKTLITLIALALVALSGSATAGTPWEECLDDHESAAEPGMCGSGGCTVYGKDGKVITLEQFCGKASKLPMATGKDKVRALELITTECGDNGNFDQMVKEHAFSKPTFRWFDRLTPKDARAACAAGPAAKARRYPEKPAVRTTTIRTQINITTTIKTR